MDEEGIIHRTLRHCRHLVIADTHSEEEIKGYQEGDGEGTRGPVASDGRGRGDGASQAAHAMRRRREGETEDSQRR